MGEALREQLLDEIMELSGERTIRPDEFTLSDYVARLTAVRGAPVPRSTAEKRLKALVDRGILVTESGVYDPRVKRTVRVYRLAERDGGDREAPTP